MKRALITGVLGQDGSYLSEYLLGLGYEVHGVAKGLPVSHPHYVSVGVDIHIGDMRDQTSLETVFRRVWPDEVYNLAGQVFVPTSWSQPSETFDVNVGGLARILKIVDENKRDTKVYQASSSEMYGNTGGSLDENSPMNPVSPYGCSKLAAHKLVDVYRQKGLFVVSGILFNHESPRRGPEMVTRKITTAVAKWVTGQKNVLQLGNLDAGRDWGHARDYVKAMYRMLQHDKPDDFVIGTGVTHTVREFLWATVYEAGLDIDLDKYLSVNPTFKRPNELTMLNANTRKAKEELGWEVETSFCDLVKEMIQTDIEREMVRRELVLDQ